MNVSEESQKPDVTLLTYGLVFLRARDQASHPQTYKIRITNCGSEAGTQAIPDMKAS
jgi:hypothetical protein